ncbi:hypothetical protein AK812_SmicGene19657 [Symbiodinium microadriaticum]|uniref:SET domain-containing protein n=1 Tax=Symbiodinium microadriaticum TaxID=2951 RepID=A0A1Q9DS10_SYMMI|nr:hypothetical protein AK812_SmicGene19657 [Symbiodinium microadriaticum]
MPAGLPEIESAGLRLEHLSEHEGRCLAAQRCFKAGSVLLVEKPIVRRSVAELSAAMRQHPHDFALLRGADNLAAAEVNLELADQSFILEAETNSFLFQGKVVGFNAFSMLNHACAASMEENVCFSILSTGDRPINDDLEVKLIAIRDIQAGEPLRVSYHELFAEPRAREERIRSHCGGRCGCSRCRLEAEKPMLADIGLQLSLERWSPRCQACNSAAPNIRPGDAVQILRHRELAGAMGITQEVRGGKTLILKTLLHGREHEGELLLDNVRSLSAVKDLHRFQHFIDKWMQAGRLPHLAPGHYAIQEALLVAIPIGSLLLWKSAAMPPEVKSEIFERLVKMVSMHVQHVQMLVPRFHIAYWTALHYVLGLLLLGDFIDALQNCSAVSLVPLTTLFESCLDVAEIFDADAAESYKSMMSHRQAQSASGSRAFQNLTADPSKLAAFYSIDPELTVVFGSDVTLDSARQALARDLRLELRELQQLGASKEGILQTPHGGIMAAVATSQTERRNSEGADDTGTTPEAHTPPDDLEGVLTPEADTAQDSAGVRTPEAEPPLDAPEGVLIPEAEPPQDAPEGVPAEPARRPRQRRGAWQELAEETLEAVPASVDDFRGWLKTWMARNGFPKAYLSKVQVADSTGSAFASCRCKDEAKARHADRVKHLPPLRALVQLLSEHVPEEEMPDEAELAKAHRRCIKGTGSKREIDTTSGDVVQAWLDFLAVQFSLREAKSGHQLKYWAAELRDDDGFLPFRVPSCSRRRQTRRTCPPVLLCDVTYKISNSGWGLALFALASQHLDAHTAWPASQAIIIGAAWVPKAVKCLLPDALLARDVRHVQANVKKHSSPSSSTPLALRDYLASRVLFSAALPTQTLFTLLWDEALERMNRTLKSCLPSNFHLLSIQDVSERIETGLQAIYRRRRWIETATGDLQPDQIVPRPQVVARFVNGDWLQTERMPWEGKRQWKVPTAACYLEYAPSNYMTKELQEFGGMRVRSVTLMPFDSPDWNIDPDTFEAMCGLVLAKSVEQALTFLSKLGAVRKDGRVSLSHFHSLMTNLCFVFQTGRIYARCGSCPHELFTRWRLGDQRAVVARMAQLVPADAPVDIAQANEGLRQEILVRQVPRRLAWLTLAKIQERLQRARDRKRKQQKDREQQLQRLYEDQDLLGLTSTAETEGVAREKALGDAQGMLGKSFVKQLQALRSMIFLKTTLKEAKSMKATELVVMLGKSTGPVAEAAKILVNAWKREVAAGNKST